MQCTLTPMTTTSRYKLVTVSRQTMLFGMADRCACCGREELKKTVPVAPVDGGDMRWFGVGCAAKACGAGLPEFRRQVRAAEVAQEAAEVVERRKAHEVELARWMGFLAQATGIHGDIYAAINKLGGYDIARSTYRAQNGE